MENIQDHNGDKSSQSIVNNNSNYSNINAKNYSILNEMNHQKHWKEQKSNGINSKEYQRNTEAQYSSNQIITNLCLPEAQDQKSQDSSGAFIKKEKSLLSRVILNGNEAIDVYVLCKLCQSIYENPVSCKGCNDFFCKDCIEQYSEANQGRCLCGKTFQMAQAHKILNTLLDKYRFRCLKYVDGCEEVIPYRDLKAHQENCDFREIECGHIACKKLIYFRDYKVHVAQCEYQEITCRFCYKRGLKKNIEQHQTQCNQRLTFCRACNGYFMYKDIKSHKASCEEMKDQCPRCLVDLKRKDLKTHSELDCIRALYEETRKQIMGQIKDLRAMVTQFEKEISDRQSFFGSKCTYCSKFACEVSKKNCNECLQPYCIPCSKRNIKHCKNCEALVCLSCFNKNDFCKSCVRKSRKMKINGRNSVTDKNFYVKEMSIESIE